MIKNTMANEITSIVKYILLSVLINCAICNACSTKGPHVPFGSLKCEHLGQDFSQIRGLWKFASTKDNHNGQTMGVYTGKMHISSSDQNGFAGQFYYNTFPHKLLSFPLIAEYRTDSLAHITTWKDEPMEAEIFICNHGQELRITSYDKKYDWIFSRKDFFKNGIFNDYIEIDELSEKVIIYDKNVELDYFSSDGTLLLSYM